jgi:glycerophosphoryl diester phosphodiesterase
MKQLSPWPYPKLIAHRGAGKLAPENTLAALRLGQHFGYSAFEFDVKLTRDRIAILLHDADLARTTNGLGRAEDWLFSDLAQLNAGGWHSKEYSGEPIPTLQNIAQYLISNGLGCNIEIKPTPGLETITGEMVAKCAQQYWASVQVKPVLSSFSYDSLAAAKTICPAMPRGFLTNELPENWLQILTDLDCASIHLSHKTLTQTTVAAIKRAGFRVCAWTVNDPKMAQDMLQWGVDSVITDCVDTIAPF